MGLEKKIKTELQTILKTLSDLHCSRPFREPVDARRYPDYFQIVTRPMDLKTLRKNVIDNKYQTSDEFYQDAQMIFDNCKLYTLDPLNPIRGQCDELERNFMYQWQNFIARRHEEQGLEHVNDPLTQAEGRAGSRDYHRSPAPGQASKASPKGRRKFIRVHRYPSARSTPPVTSRTCDHCNDRARAFVRCGEVIRERLSAA